MNETNVVLLFLVSVAGGFGACLRYVVDGVTTLALSRCSPRHEFPWGLWLVNISGSLAIGLVAGLVTNFDGDTSTVEVLTVGLLGGYTTFSSASYDTIVLLRERRWFAGFANSFLMLFLAVLAVLLGLWCGQLH